MNIIIYSRKNCLPCYATKREMEKRGFRFTLIDIEQNPSTAAKLRAAGHSQLPVVITDDMCWSGFRPDMINRLPRPGARVKNA
ncbi:glutaredoxin domain-containing protein [Apirhabdus apintestini]|uniref:glutaredoxin domain-containing protein n=1 Tax=Erwinia sp. HR93 TaxID=3094840 RepID=UPI002ADEEE20|nr:glutaredoxin domain-containing protein [Erwinia sp. HR93]MEA1064226.1 glutaredoxin domain-containing protein [Erwinia sp. HR93]WPM86110.1 glutaredoxin domain-containing protein [Enterobacteriaceae bacterium CA-0114]